MATISLYYDNKSKKVALNISHLGVHARHSLPVSVQPNQWDKDTHSVTNHPTKKELNIYLQSILAKSQTELLQLATTERLRSLSASDIRNKICEAVLNTKKEEKTHLFADVYFQFAGLRKSQSSQRTYKHAFNHVKKYDPDWETLRFEDITPAWLDGLDRELTKTMPKPLSRKTFICCIQAVVNYAIANDYTTYTGFTKFKMPKGIAEKRAFSLDEIRKVFNYQGKTPQQQRAIDTLKIIFFLRGINFKDLSSLTEESIKDGRVTYFRAKTGAYYDIKIEPETAELLEQYKGKKKLLAMFDKCTNYESPYTYFNYILREIEKEVGIKHITSYYFRHTWATIGFNECGIPMEVLSIGLGHSYGLNTTNMYITKNNRLADKANRLIMDYVLYDKKERWEY